MTSTIPVRLGGGAPAAEPPALRRTLTTPRIVFLVVAAAAPMSGVVGSVPLAYAIGNGAGVPATFALAGLILLCFSVGYAAMSRHVVGAGGFYTYVGQGLGRPPAVAAGLMAVLAYTAAVAGVAGAFGYFAELVSAAHGLPVPWPVWTGGALALTAVMGYRRIDLSARLLAVLMVAEVAVLGLLALAIGVRHGTDTLPAAAFRPETVLAPGLGVALMFALISYVGFEAAALYGEESRDPKRSVPVATYASVVLITVFFALMSWAAVGAVGADRVAETAGRELGDLFFHLSDDYLGTFATSVMQVLLCTSLFGALLGLHTAANRYLFVLGRERVLPGSLARVHPRHGSPHRASAVLSVATAAVCAVFALAGAHPYTNLATTMLALGTVGIVALQAAVAVAVLVFFRGHPEAHWWRTRLAPVLALAGLVGALWLLLDNFALVTGSTSPWVNRIPWLMAGAALGGLGHARWLRSRSPERYRAIATASPHATPHPTAHVTDED
ncbi:APC family permease [Streptomyces katrae]|uniref:APC family permease n=1 Tax=Streptomyces katrae TaxID=68223 RepID=A0ABT7GPF7_9ACTN|nr:APC family permease [Streptomyces katrae]MDK9495468.1 APC family permease [Streptomyces katrae]